MKVITIANQKGGTGKTTTALCLGAELEAKGYKVLYIDLDNQSNSSTALNADITQKGCYEMLTEKTPASELIQTTQNGQSVIAGNEKIANIDAVLNGAKNQVGKEYRTKESLESVKDQFDFAIIDTAANLNTATINALTATDYLIIVANADAFSLEGVSMLFNITDVIKQYTNKDMQKGGVLLTRYSDRTNINRAFKEEIKTLAETYGTKLFNTCIRENVAVRESQALRQRITDYAPNSNANKDYLAFTEEVLKDIKA